MTIPNRPSLADMMRLPLGETARKLLRKRFRSVKSPGIYLIPRVAALSFWN